MEHTKNYHLPQWAEENRIMMEDFNEAMADIDAGIAAAQTAATAAQSTATQGVAKAEAAQSAAQSAAEKNCMVKVFETTLTGSANNIAIDLSGVDMSNVNRLVIQAEGYFNNSNSGFKMRINNSSAAAYYQQQSETPLSVLPVSDTGYHIAADIELFPMGNYVMMHYLNVYSNDKVTSFSGSNSGGASKVCALSGITRLTLYAMDYSLNFSSFGANSHVAVYAITK